MTLGRTPTLVQPVPIPPKYIQGAGGIPIRLLSNAPIVWGCLPDRFPGAKIELVGTLYRRLARLDLIEELPADRDDLRLVRNHLGKPELYVGTAPGPFVSFSHSPGHLFAAMSPLEPVGIDAAFADEFEDDYPLDRAFSTDEWSIPADIAPIAALRAALLWALKEAAVKALGVGFHHWDPLSVRVSSVWSGCHNELMLFLVIAGENLIRAWADRLPGNGWLALARLEETNPTECYIPGRPRAFSR